jgi:hypothetical protein
MTCHCRRPTIALLDLLPWMPRGAAGYATPWCSIARGSLSALNQKARTRPFKNALQHEAQVPKSISAAELKVLVKISRRVVVHYLSNTLLECATTKAKLRLLTVFPGTVHTYVLVMLCLNAEGPPLGDEIQVTFVGFTFDVQ